MDLSADQQNLDRFATVAWAWTAAFLPRLIAAIAILVIGAALARWLSRAVWDMSGRTTHIDPILRPVVASSIRYSILILVCVAALSQIGVQTASLLAVLGAAGLAIGLALQGTLSNIAAGLMLLWLRPFRIGDFIEVNGMAGTVREIGLFVCHLETLDGIFLFAPNSAIWNNALRNHTRNAGRLISLQITIPAAAAVDRARGVLLDMVKGDSRILRTPEPQVFVDGLGGAGIALNLRIWVAREHVGEIQRMIIEEARDRLEATKIDVTPQQIVRVIPPDSDPSRLLSPSQPFAE
jgi:small conductance mechanosensitive channel